METMKLNRSQWIILFGIALIISGAVIWDILAALATSIALVITGGAIVLIGPITDDM